jgi:hypothetical protein
MKVGDKVKVTYEKGEEEIQTIGEVTSKSIPPFNSPIFHFSDGVGKWAFEFQCEKLNEPNNKDCTKLRG